MIKAQVYESIREIDPAVWDALLDARSLTVTHAFWTIVEESGLNDFQYRYVLFTDDDGQTVGQTTFYMVTTDIAIFAPQWLRRVLEKVRLVFPSFLKLKMLECGTPIILNSPPLVLHPDLALQDIIPVWHRTLQAYARRSRALVMVLRDFESEEAGWLHLLRGCGYHIVPGLPNTYLDVRWDTIDEYRDDLKSYYRSKINNHLHKNAQLQVRHDLVEDFAPLADELCRQWLIVHERANEFQREVLTPAFYRELSLGLEGAAKVLRFFREDVFVGHALLLHDRDTLRWLYFGRAEPINDSLYLYVAQAVIETAINLKVRRLEMGLTTYSVKQDVGARLESIHFAIRCPWVLLNPFFGLGYSLLNKPAKLENKMIFKSSRVKEG